MLKLNNFFVTTLAFLILEDVHCRHYFNFKVGNFPAKTKTANKIAPQDNFLFPTSVPPRFNSQGTLNVIPSYRKVPGVCKKGRIYAVQEVSNVFPLVYLDTDNWKCLHETKKEDDLVSQSYDASHKKKLDVNALIEVNPEWLFKPKLFLDEYIKPSRTLNGIRIVGLIFPMHPKQDSSDIISCNGGHYKQILMDYSKKISVGFISPALEINKFLSTLDSNIFISELCYASFAHFLVMEFVVDFKNLEIPSIQDFKDKVLRQLDRLQELKNHIVKMHPQTTVYVHVKPVITPAIQSEIEGGVYCGNNLKNVDDILATVINWGKVKNTSVILREIVEYPANEEKSLSWLRPLTPFVNDNWTIDGFFSRQNLNILGKSEGESCIEWTEVVPDNGTSFENVHLGTSIDLKSLKISEAGTSLMLSFAKHKFKNIEIQAPLEVAELKSVLDSNELSSLTSVLIDLTIQNGSEIRLNSQFNGFQEIVEKLSKGNHSYAGVHISKLESLENLLGVEFEEHLSRLKEFAKGHNVKVGLMFKRCGHEAYILISQNSKSYMDKVSYVICETEKIEAINDNKSQMTAFLDKQLLTVKFLKRRVSHLKIFFRLNLHPVNDNYDLAGSEEGYLRFLNDINTYAKTNNIHYFLPAFDNPTEKQVGWWKVNEPGFSQVSSYLEREARYLNGETWKPEFPDEDFSYYFYIYIGLGISILLASVIAIAVCLRQRNQNGMSKILSKLEVEKFYNGDFELSASLIKGVATYKARKFKKAFELPKQEFNLKETNKIDEGQLYVIYKDHIRNRPVAVKVPKLDIRKEIFISMLSELKMLCSAGRHPNIVEFVGAYTLEIHVGILYAVTEFCNMGSLLSYLKKLKLTEAKSENKAEDVDIVNKLELIRFSEEIASGMEYIGEQDILHGDLSARNVLLTDKKICKIGDFGFSRKIRESSDVLQNDKNPPQWRWMAYESLTQNEFTTMSDVWSYGVTLWEMFTLGDLPFSQVHNKAEFEDNLKNGMRLEMPQNSTKEIFQIMQTCWNIEPALRPKFTELKMSFGKMENEWLY